MAGLPFRMEIPNYSRQTLETMKEAKRISRDPDTRGYNSMEELTLNCHPFYISFFPVLQKDP